MLHQTTRDLFDELMGRLADQEFKNRGFNLNLMENSFEEYDKILDELNEKFELLELEIIKIETDAAFNGDK